jgi:acetyl-CoA carboxylase biotin carboxylase subunit
MFNKILIANRGEIAVRVIRACREMGIRSVAVYSEADAASLHVRLADEAYPIGPAPALQSYLNQEHILHAAQASRAEAIHPGYGFLSENAGFAEAVAQAGMVFIGPPASAIRAMGDKAAARAVAQQAGTPVTPGYQGADDDQALIEAAPGIGYPLLVKAAAGGGGKGMRVVRRPEELAEAIASARREAEHAFKDSRLILERYIQNAHHVEFQILGDQHGHMLYVFERECSVQRRHQKIIEESPSPLLDETLRREMGQAAVAAAQAAGYTNAGTMEFIVDPHTRQFYFLEMNTRLQVEHPVTEMISGLDLVQWQIRIAAGERLPFKQEELRARGHAIECRLYAEDPANGFLPATGSLLRFIEPKGPGVRVDTGVTSGDEISIHYDPMIAKLIVHAEDRPAAIRKMLAALRDTVLLGLTTNARFLQDVLTDEQFQAGQVHTTWVEPRFAGWQHPTCDLPPEALIAAALTQLQASDNATGQVEAGVDPYSPWRLSSGFRLGEG